MKDGMQTDSPADCTQGNPAPELTNPTGRKVLAIPENAQSCDNVKESYYLVLSQVFLGDLPVCCEKESKRFRRWKAKYRGDNSQFIFRCYICILLLYCLCIARARPAAGPLT